MSDATKNPTHCPACRSDRLVGNENESGPVKFFGLNIARSISEGLTGPERFVTCLECGIRRTYLTASELERCRTAFESTVPEKMTIDDI